MPYITPAQRAHLNQQPLSKLGFRCLSAGELNYAISYIVGSYLTNGENYQRYNDVMGALEGAKLELYRRHAAPYEDKKIFENGDLSIVRPPENDLPQTDNSEQQWPFPAGNKGEY